MSDTLCQIKISDIDISDDRYRIEIPTDLIQNDPSIFIAGLAYPPIVRPVHDRYVVVAGFDQVEARLKDKSADTIHVLKTRKDITELECLKRSIAAVRFKHPLSAVEILRSVERLHQMLTVDEIQQSALEILGQSLNKKYIEKLIAINTLPHQALVLIANQRLSLKVAEKLISLNKEDLSTILDLFDAVKASKNKQLEIVQFLVESSNRDHISIKEVMLKLDAHAIVSDDSLDSNTKLNKIRNLLYNYRFPTLSKFLSTQSYHIRQLKLNTIQFVPAQNVENQSFQISFNAKTLNEYSSKVMQLTDTISHESITEIFKK